MTRYQKSTEYVYPEAARQVGESFRVQIPAAGRLLQHVLCLVLVLTLLTAWAPLCLGEGAAAETGAQTGTDPLGFVDPVGQADRCSAVLYNNTNGLPTSEANAIAETGDGFIWVGSYSGLSRYDGNSFLRIDSTSGITGVISLFVDSRDRLWIGTNDNGVALMERGSLRRWSLEDGLPSAKVCAVCEDVLGTIYVGTTEGIAVIDKDLKLRMMEEPELKSIYVVNFCASSDGMVYGLSNQDDVFTLFDGSLSSYIDGEESPVRGSLSIYADKTEPGYVYIGAEPSSMYYGDVSAGLENAKELDVTPLRNVIWIEKIGDRLWLCATNGIGVLDEEGLHILDNLPMNNNVVQVMADYEGNLWFTSSRQGLMKIVPNRFTDLSARFHLPDMVVNSTVLQDGRLFLASDTGLTVLNEKDRTVVESIPLTKAETASGRELEAKDLIELMAGIRVRSIIRDSRERLWFSTWSGPGLLRYDHGEVLAFGPEDGLFSDRIRVVCERGDGAMLVVNSGGVSVIEGDRVTAGYGKGDGVINTESLTVSWADNGDIILGSNGDGIYVITENGTRHISYEEGLSSGIVMRVKRDPKRNIFWLVTSNSIGYMTADYQVKTVRSFPYSNNFDLYESDNGDMWVLSSNGIYVLPTEKLLEDRVQSPVHYSMASGLPSVATSNSYSELTEDGELYIAGNRGVAKVNIDQPMEIVSSLKTSIPYLEADGVRVYADRDGVFHLSHRVHKVTVYGYVFNYALSDPRVSWQMKGFDWQPTTVNRKDLAPVVYTNLPGGSYEFVMVVQDSLGLSSKSYSVQIVKEKAFYEQGIFFIACALGVILLLGASTMLYINRKTRLMEIRNREALKQERLNTELKMANLIQGSILPHDFPPFPERKEFDIYAIMDPAREVGGDFYDFFLIDEDHLCLVMADVSGKGIPASLFMMISKVIVQSCAMFGQDPAEILTKTNEALCSKNTVDMFVTVWVGILEISTGTITAANAGHEYPAIMKDGVFTLLKDRHGFVIGGMEGVPYHEYEIQLEPGDKIFLYTDGVPEATDAGGNMFGTERMLTALNKEAGGTPETILGHVRRDVDAFVKEAEQFDDLTMMCLEYKGRGTVD